MNKLLTSPAKLVFLLVAITVCIAFMSGLLSENNFMILAGGAFTFFFAYKGNSNKDNAGK